MEITISDKTEKLESQAKYDELSNEIATLMKSGGGTREVAKSSMESSAPS
jgi:hypothetical protein